MHPSLIPEICEWPSTAKTRPHAGRVANVRELFPKTPARAGMETSLHPGDKRARGYARSVNPPPYYSSRRVAHSLTLQPADVPRGIRLCSSRCPLPSPPMWIRGSCLERAFRCGICKLYLFFGLLVIYCLNSLCITSTECQWALVSIDFVIFRGECG